MVALENGMVWSLSDQYKSHTYKKLKNATFNDN